MTPVPTVLYGGLQVTRPYPPASSLPLRFRRSASTGANLSPSPLSSADVFICSTACSRISTASTRSGAVSPRNHRSGIIPQPLPKSQAMSEAFGLAKYERRNASVPNVCSLLVQILIPPPTSSILVCVCAASHVSFIF